MIDQDQNQQSDELKIFHDVAKALTSSLDLDTVLQTILEKVAAYFQPATWSLLMLDDDSQELYYVVAVGKGSESVNALRLKSGETLARRVVDLGEPLVIADVNQDSRIDPESKDDSFPSPGSIVCVPVRTGGKAAIPELKGKDENIT